MSKDYEDETYPVKSERHGNWRVTEEGGCKCCGLDALHCFCPCHLGECTKEPQAIFDDFESEYPYLDSLKPMNLDEIDAIEDIFEPLPFEIDKPQKIKLQIGNYEYEGIVTFNTIQPCEEIDE
jgi:hypothetical protein